MGNKMTDEAEILALEHAALVRWGNGDPDGFLEISADDVVYFDPFIAHRIDGLAALTAYYDRIRGQVHVARFELIDPHVVVMENAAVLTFHDVSWNADGVEKRWNCTEVYRRDPVGWRIVQTHWSYTTPKFAESA